MSMIMPVVEARRIQRQQSCGNCFFHDFAKDGRTMECHEDSIQGVLVQQQGQQPSAIGYWPPTDPAAWCGKHKPYIATNGNGS